jgi:hypothetical protein
MPGGAPLKNLMAVTNLNDVLKKATPNRTYHRSNVQIDYLLLFQPSADNLKTAASNVVEFSKPETYLFQK